MDFRERFFFLIRKNPAGAGEGHGEDWWSWGGPCLFPRV